MDDQVRYYEAKLQYEIDPWDLNEALGRGDKIHRRSRLLAVRRLSG
jgi:hypothetical protein